MIRINLLCISGSKHYLDLNIKRITVYSSKKLITKSQSTTSVQNIEMYHLMMASMYFSSPPRRLTKCQTCQKIKSSQVSGLVGGKRKSNYHHMILHVVEMIMSHRHEVYSMVC